MSWHCFLCPRPQLPCALSAVPLASTSLRWLGASIVVSPRLPLLLLLRHHLAPLATWGDASKGKVIQNHAGAALHTCGVQTASLGALQRTTLVANWAALFGLYLISKTRRMRAHSHTSLLRALSHDHVCEEQANDKVPPTPISTPGDE